MTDPCRRRLPAIASALVVALHAPMREPNYAPAFFVLAVGGRLDQRRPTSLIPPVLQRLLAIDPLDA